MFRARSPPSLPFAPSLLPSIPLSYLFLLPTPSFNMPPRPRNLKLPLSAFTSTPAAEELSAGPVFKSTIDSSVDVAALKDEAGLGFEGWTSESGRKVAGGVAVVR